MKHTLTKSLALLLVLLLSVGAFSACGKQAQSAVQEQAQGPSARESAGTFSMTGLYGETVTQEAFKNAKVTLVNVMATWCGPCVRELPELQKLSEKYKEQGLQVIAIVMDTVDAKGATDAAAVSTAKDLAVKSGATIPMLMPTPNALAGKLNSVSSLPTTFFVDADGKFIGKPYVGGKDLKGWSAVVEKILEKESGKAE